MTYMSIDFNAKPLIVLTMSIKRLLLLFALFVFIFAPSIDCLACDDCSIPLHGKGLDENDHLCSICLNAIEGFDSYSHKTLLLEIPFKHQITIIVYPEVSFPIKKPPQT